MHDDQLLRALCCKAQIVGDEENGGTSLAGLKSEVIEDTALDSDVQCRGRLVRDEEFRVRSEPDGNQHALTHTTRELVRELLRAPLGIRQSRLFEDLGNTRAHLGACHHVVGLEGLLHLGTHAPHRIEVRHRVLRDHANTISSQRHPFLLGLVGDIASVELDGPAGHLSRPGKQADDGRGGRGLSGARLAHDSHGLTGIDRQVCAANSRNHARRRLKGDVQVGDAQQRLVLCSHVLLTHRLRALGSRASRTTSPIMMKDSTVIASANAG